MMAKNATFLFVQSKEIQGCLHFRRDPPPPACIGTPENFRFCDFVME